MTFGSLVLALVAGMLSVLSPCVLPILPIVLGAAASERKWGPVALATGLSVSFVARSCGWTRGERLLPLRFVV